MTDSIDATPRGGVEAPDRFRTMMRGFPTGVAVVTATDLAGQPWGMTCSSVCSVTLDPPTLLISLRSASPTLAAILGCGRFTVNLLHDRAWRTAELFASGNPGRFDLVDWDLDADSAGPHLGSDAHAAADCRVGTTVPAGDHTVVFGEAYRITLRPGHPLLYGLRGYRRWPSAEPTN
ncbi:flavin reductase family protein [Kutzneria buriramensis]|uniref:Flavin reductase (DIM6/NTAB) family NADH-FMN oxidoreductase RutF n=1 Tax=Kutzneria buriramensis TaxID=1045776 RepID=A0A3E0HKH7_9PSEU|nr:flavin reductase family protein [Kutzneria buriramensis]REH46917.1 flavin reductase (DIM6/NTAB) family NADH-FMN oxidoreductase RutF [Kutzneria buriramensis]